MIKITRPKAVPAVFNSPLMKKARAEIAGFYKIPAKERSQQKLPYVELSSVVLKQIRKTLDKLFNGKCAYCETQVGDIMYGDFDHFRPRTSSRGLGKEFSADHYGWLAYTWTNMYLSCQDCNKHKINWFPIEPKTSRAEPLSSYEEVLAKEKPLFVDPCNDDPEDHFKFNPDGTVLPKSKKGETTLELLNLNRRRLVENRKRIGVGFIELLSKFKNASDPHAKNTSIRIDRTMNDFVETVTSMFMNKSQHIAVQRAILKQWLDKERDIRELIFTGVANANLNKGFISSLLKVRSQLVKPLRNFYSEPIMHTASLKTYKAPASGSSANKRTKKITTRINLDRIEVKNFKAIEELTISFPQSHSKQESWLMFLGENGVGKSTMLQALTLTLMGSDYFSKSGLRLKAKDVLRHECHEGHVKIYSRESEHPVEMSFNLKDNKIRHSSRNPSSFLLAYGSTRLFKTGTFREEPSKGLVKAKNMFDPSYALADANKWIAGIKDNELFGKVAIAIKDLLLFTNKEKLVREKDKVYVHYKNKSPDTLNELSDGYKSVIAVTTDIMKTLVNANTNMEAAEGIVILDEIGTHLHPRWKMEVVKRFRNVFPRLQFIVTTHDPLCLRSLKKGEVIVFSKDRKQKIHINADLPDPGALNAEQLLSSEFFGLNSTKDPEIEEAFNKYYYLLSRKRLTPKQVEKLEDLKDFLKDKKHMGDSLRDEIVLNATDKLLAQTRENKLPTSRFVLEEETMKSIKQAYQLNTNN